MILQSPGFVKPRDKLNTIYLHLQETYGHQTRQGAGLLAPTLKAINLKKLNLFHKAFGY